LENFGGKTYIPQQGLFPSQNKKFYTSTQNSASSGKLWSLLMYSVGHKNMPIYI